MDSLKSYRKNDDDFEGLLSTVKKSNGDIWMQFGLENV